MKTKPIHAGKGIFEGCKTYLFLIEKEREKYVWERDGKPTGVEGRSVAEAIQNALKRWKLENFSTLHCGHRFTLPERDEHGSHALFHQMGSSYDAYNGIYFDEELGHTCIVKDASQEALNLWKKVSGNE